MKISIAICEDVTAHRHNLRGLLEKWAAFSGNTVSIDDYANPLTLVSALEDHLGFYDIFFIDIGLGDSLDGFALAKEIRRYHLLAPLVFVTQSTRGYQEARALDALHYLVKPVSYEDVATVMNQVSNLLLQGQGREESFCFTTNRENICLPFHAILYLECLDHTVCINNNPLYSFRGSLDSLQSRLPATFVRSHRSYIVNFDHMTQLTAKGLFMKDAREIPLGRTYSKNVMDALRSYVKNR